MRFENKDDPMLWINRAKNDYLDVRDSLCVTGSAPKGKLSAEISNVSAIRKGILITLNRYAFQDGDHLLIPVNRDEAAGWNVPLNAMFKEAIANTADLFPPRIYDLMTSEYIDYSRSDTCAYDYERTAPIPMAAESPGIYEVMPAAPDSGLRLIVSTSPLVGDAPILYPDMLYLLGRTMKKDPTILICEPGKLFVFDDPNRQAVDRYISRYKKRFGITSPEPRVYKYFRKNKLLLDNTSADDTDEFNPPKETNIPRGSIASAWGDMECRNKLLDWKRRYGRNDGGIR